MSDPTSRPLSARAQAILERVEREARAAPTPVLGRPDPAEPPLSSGWTPPEAHPAQTHPDPMHGLTRPQPVPATTPAQAPTARAPTARAPGSEPDPATTAQLLALVNALAQRTEVARRQLEELTTALDALMTDLSAPGALAPPGDQGLRTPNEPAAPPAVRWPTDLR